MTKRAKVAVNKALNTKLDVLKRLNMNLDTDIERVDPFIGSIPCASHHMHELPCYLCSFRERKFIQCDMLESHNALKAQNGISTTYDRVLLGHAMSGLDYPVEGYRFSFDNVMQFLMEAGRVLSIDEYFYVDTAGVAADGGQLYTRRLRRDEDFRGSLLTDEVVDAIHKHPVAGPIADYESAYLLLLLDTYDTEPLEADSYRRYLEP